METPIEIIIVDNVKLFRTTLLNHLSSFNYIHCVAEANNGKELLRLLQHGKTGIVLLDLEMPVMDGNEAMNEIVKHFPQTKVIIISGCYEEILVEDFIARGAKGYLAKDEILGNTSLLVEALQCVRRGGVFVHRLPLEEQVNPFKYTKKDKVIVPYIVQGFTNEDIAEATGVKIRTVERQRKRIYSKIGGTKAIDFFRYAFSKGLHYLSARKKKTL